MNLTDIKTYGEMGLSHAEIIAKMRISITRHYELMEDNEDYKAAMHQAYIDCYAWWVQQGRMNVTGEKENQSFSPSAYNFIMQNLFGWSTAKPKEFSVIPISSDPEREAENVKRFKVVK